MKGQKRHPGGTGVYMLKDPGFTLAQREGFLNAVRQWDLKDLDEDALWEGVNCAASWYYAAKKVADESSVGSMRTNLKRAIKRALRLLEGLMLLDGNSHQIANHLVASHNIIRDAESSLQALQQTLLYVERTYPPRGRRPEYERLNLAVDLVALLTKCSSVTACRENRELLDAFVGEVFHLIGLVNADVMLMVDQALSAEWYVDFSPGVRVFDREAKSPKK